MKIKASIESQPKTKNLDKALVENLKLCQMFEANNLNKLIA